MFRSKFYNLLKVFLQKLFHLTPFKLGVGITFLCIVSLIYHYSLIISPQKNNLDILEVIENKFYDLRFLARGPLKASSKVGILAVDDASVAMFGRWPFSRSIYGKIFNNLKKKGVKWIGLDVLFTEKSRRSLTETKDALEHIILSPQKSIIKNEKDFITFMEKLEESSPSDSKLKKSIEDFGNIVQGYFYTDSIKQVVGSDYNWIESFLRLGSSIIKFHSFPANKNLLSYKSMLSQGAITNTADIAGESPIMGFTNNQADSDGIYRKTTLVHSIEPTDSSGKVYGAPWLLPSMPLKVAAEYLNSSIFVEFNQTGIVKIKLISKDDDKKVIDLPTYYDGNGRMLINHYGPLHSLKIVSLKDAWLDTLPDDTPDILILGGLATGTNDNRASPFDESFDGVGFMVTVVSNIIQNFFVKRPVSAVFYEIIYLIIIGLLFSYILRRISALKSFLVVGLYCTSIYYIDKYFIFGNGYWIYLGIIYIQCAFIYFGIILFKYFTEEKEKRQVKNAFQYYLSPSVIDEIMRNPDGLKLGGEKKNVTIFFSDIRNFTTISEKLLPEELTRMLNDYMTPMTNIILESKGLLDKYIGDAIMAIWGTPYSLENHADLAIEAGLKMLKNLSELHKKWNSLSQPCFHIGIGINTGDVIVGNMGSAQRFDYTVIGDAVNLASRIESVNKVYGTQIICSEFTRSSLINPHKFNMRELDCIRVKGKDRPVKIYDVMNNHLENSLIDEAIGHFESGLEKYRQQKWQPAMEEFKNVIKILGTDKPSEVYIERCQQLKHTPPSSAWDGVWTFQKK